MKMKPSQNCIKLVKSFEGCSLTPYLDSDGVVTIGYGSTFYLDGSKVGVNDPPISQETADNLLIKVLSEFGSDILEFIKVPLTQNQFDALCDFTYNLGVEAFKESTLLKYLNEKKYNDAALQFPLWDHVKGVVFEGLLNRRMVEQKLFLS